MIPMAWRGRALGIAVAVGFLLLMSGLYFLSTRPGGMKHMERMKLLNEPREYAYSTATASNGMELHVLQTDPANVTLSAVRNNLTLAPFYGINGGFFFENDLLSMAIVNGLPVAGAAGTYGAGGENVKYARGTLVWDGAADALSVQVVKRPEELQVTDRASYWAQGGISMSLGRDDAWVVQTQLENAPFAEDDRLRSAAVYDDDGRLYLVVSRTRGTLTAFREAIRETVGQGKLKDGVFLDGDGSSQLRSREMSLSGDNRPVIQMMSLIH
ncbi:hypothetical protein [Cohnella nanjingensis]|uniref:Phosphodiester glycosidase domain-containing protein n=1 Tax=Cohnella nanjingensis TaxID=1387779 RepID=A0A7X0RPX0_9BACL|nr:hypothetical protein [Cohnella nanjingensis]MBB6671532.1 hypothetical protein [Cohnella nanjingensis]